MNGRLETLEATLPDSQAIDEQTEQDRQDAEREHALWEALFSTMAPGHVEHVLAELTAWLEGDESDGTMVPRSALTRRAYSTVHQAFHQSRSDALLCVE